MGTGNFNTNKIYGVQKYNRLKTKWKYNLYILKCVTGTVGQIMEKKGQRKLFYKF